MPFAVRPALVALFGSATRVRVLAALANALVPRTAYSIAKMVGVLPPKVYREIRRLEESRIVACSKDRRGVKRYKLVDEEIGKYIARRAYIITAEDLRTIALSGPEQGASRVRLDPGDYRPNQAAVSYRDEFVRRKGKDEELVRAGLTPSRKRKWTRRVRK